MNERMNEWIVTCVLRCPSSSLSNEQTVNVPDYSIVFSTQQLNITLNGSDIGSVLTYYIAKLPTKGTIYQLSGIYTMVDTW